MARLCSVEGCERKHLARGFCSRHWERWRRYGDPLAGGHERIVGDVDARFESFVNRSDGECWTWVGRRHRDGYGHFSVGGQWVSAHRWAYERFVGPIPEGLQLDHLCRNRACVNPAHLEPVTNRENGLRGVSAEVNRARQLSKSRCKHGHSLIDDSNVRRVGNRRICRACARAKQAAYYAARKGGDRDRV